MKKSFAWCILVCACLALTSCASGSKTTNSASAFTDSTAPVYDAALAQQLGSDKNGMRQYVMAFLKSGPNRSQSPEEAQAIQKAHMDNIQRMADEGKLILAGPFMDKGDLRGIYVFNVTTLEEAQKLTETDPAVKAGRLVMELHPWYGSAALLQVNETHKKLVPPATDTK